MEIIPAIDLRDGKCVRLYKGDFARETIYGDDPFQIALKFQKAGAKRLHIIDLDGAKTGKLVNFEIVQKIAQKIALPVQYGGGLRTIKEIFKVLESKIERIILGSILFSPEYSARIKELVGKQADKFIGALDVRDEQVVIKGWQEKSAQNVFSAGKKLLKMGFKRFLVTDVNADGTLAGPNLSLYKKLVEKFSAKIIASGGVGSFEEIGKLKETGVEAAVVGKAFYAGNLNLDMFSFETD